MNFWADKKVLITGHTGFKGSWLSLWLQRLGANVVGYSIDPPSEINLYSLADVSENMVSLHGDIRDREHLSQIIELYQPEIIFHLAAQPIVRSSFADPVLTFDVNVMGTVNLLDGLRNNNSARVIINVTSDKCYENREWPWGYREIDPMGGADPYSASKGCAELVTNAFRRSFFHGKDVYLASVRAGNVIGGGDWAEDRLVPDIVRACHSRRPVNIRNPHAVRPWQHVLEPLNGYMSLAEKLWEYGESFSEGWNFGPDNENILTVEEITRELVTRWGDGATWNLDHSDHPKESQILQLDCSKAKNKLGWTPVLNLDKTLEWTIDAYKHYYNGFYMQDIVLKQIGAYENLRGIKQ